MTIITRLEEILSKALNEDALKTLFLDARTHNGWADKPVEDSVLNDMWNLVRMAPTSANCAPARIVFVKSNAAKDQLKHCLMDGNVDKTMAAPVTAIIGYDMEFYEKLPQLFPHADARSWFVGNDKLIEETAFRNSTLQGAYLIMAARSLGLDCGPMSGFDNAKVDDLFFSGTNVQSNFLCNIGYGTEDDLFPRSPRFEFDEVCRIA